MVFDIVPICPEDEESVTYQLEQTGFSWMYINR